jgi:hypothetical protein
VITDHILAPGIPQAALKGAERGRDAVLRREARGIASALPPGVTTGERRQCDQRRARYSSTRSPIASNGMRLKPRR